MYGVIRRPGFDENIGGKALRFNSCRGIPMQNILFNINDDEDDEHKEGVKNNGRDEDNENNENENEDVFEYDKG